MLGLVRLTQFRVCLNLQAVCRIDACINTAEYFTGGTPDLCYCVDHVPNFMIGLSTTVRRKPRPAPAAEATSLGLQPVKCCGYEGCRSLASLCVAGTTAVLFCGEHALLWILNNARSARCNHPGCHQRPSYGAVGTMMSLFCVKHAIEGHVDVRKIKITGRNRLKESNHPGCHTRSSFGVAGNNMGQMSSGHATEGLVNVIGGRKEVRTTHKQNKTLRLDYNRRCPFSGGLSHSLSLACPPLASISPKRAA